MCAISTVNPVALSNMKPNNFHGVYAERKGSGDFR